MTTTTTQPKLEPNQFINKLIDISEVIDIVQISRTQIFNLVKVNRFPQSVEILDGDNRRIRKTFWKLSDVQDWITDLENKKTTQEL